MTVNSRLKSNPWLVLEIERTLNDEDIQCTSSLPQLVICKYKKMSYFNTRSECFFFQMSSTGKSTYTLSLIIE